MQEPKNFIRCEQGAVAMIFGIIAVPMLLGIGAAVEYSQTINIRSDLQNYLDAAVLYGIVNETEQETQASNYFTSEAKIDFGENVEFDPQYDESTGILSATAKVRFETSFMKLAGINNIDIEVSARAINPPAPPPNCIYLMNPNIQEALIMNQGAEINAPDCGVQVHSNNASAAVFNRNIVP